MITPNAPLVWTPPGTASPDIPLSFEVPATLGFQGFLSRLQYAVYRTSDGEECPVGQIALPSAPAP